VELLTRMLRRRAGVRQRASLGMQPERAAQTTATKSVLEMSETEQKVEATLQRSAEVRKLGVEQWPAWAHARPRQRSAIQLGQNLLDQSLIQARAMRRGLCAQRRNVRYVSPPCARAQNIAGGNARFQNASALYKFSDRLATFESEHLVVSIEALSPRRSHARMALAHRRLGRQVDQGFSSFASFANKRWKMSQVLTNQTVRPIFEASAPGRGRWSLSTPVRHDPRARTGLRAQTQQGLPV
jgi:hypothetical protein